MSINIDQFSYFEKLAVLTRLYLELSLPVPEALRAAKPNQRRFCLVADSGLAAMDSLFNDMCVLVTAAYVLTFVPGLRLQDRSLLSMRDRGTALLVFLVLGLVEEASVSRSGLLNERIVAVCAAGLLAGPWVGVAVRLVVALVAGGVD